MYSIDLAWKEFNVNLDAVESWLRSNAGPHYTGNSAASNLTLWFEEQPDDSAIQALNAYWEGITSTSAEAATYKSKDEIKAAIDAAKDAALTATWDQLNAGQRKMILGLPVKREDLEL